MHKDNYVARSQSWRRFVKGCSPALLGILLLTGCGSSGATGTPSTAASSGSASPAVTGAAAAKSAAGTSASASVGAATEKPPIKIGVILSLSGPLASGGKDDQTGFTQYIASINNSVAGRKVQVIYADDEGKPDVGLAKAQQLVESDHVQILAGIISTPICYAVATYAKKAQVPFAVTGDCGAQNLTTDPKFASPYIFRFTETNNQQFSPPADWAYKQGHRKAVVITSDFGGGIEVSDAFSSTFIDRGGTILQEMHPPLGTSDFGPYLAQIDKSADILAVFLPGTDGLHFGTQYPTYIDRGKMTIFDMGANITDPVNLVQLKEKSAGLIADFSYTTAIDNQQNKDFIKAFQSNHPGQFPPLRSGQGYAGAEVLVAALQHVNGNIEQKQQFLDALAATNMETVKGPVKLDKYHDIVQTMYVYQVVQDGDHYVQKIVDKYPEASQFWGRTPEQSLHFPFGQLKGKWVGMTKAGLSKLEQ